MRPDLAFERPRGTGLVDVLDRILDKGLVIAGDVKISLAEVELLTIRVRLIVCSLDKAEEIGLDWWKYDHHLAPGKHQLSAENEALRRQVRQLERELDTVTGAAAAPPRAKALRRRRSLKPAVARRGE